MVRTVYTLILRPGRPELNLLTGAMRPASGAQRSYSGITLTKDGFVIDTCSCVLLAIEY